MMTRYVVLRDLSGNWRRSIVRRHTAVMAEDTASRAEPQVHYVDATPQDLRALKLDPTTLAVAPAMPTRLIDPQPMDDLRDGDVTPGWGINAMAANVSELDGGGTCIAVLDTGLDPSHPAFDGVTLITRDFTKTGFDDVNGHGTHVAGTILGRDLGNQRIGIARGCNTLLAAKAVADTGRGASEDFLNAFIWATQNGADLVCFALSFDLEAQIARLTAEGYPAALATAAALTAYRGNLRIFETLLTLTDGPDAPLVLAAVGNDSLRTISPDFETGPSSPAAARGVVAVGGLARLECGLGPLPFSNLGAAIVAPGAGILSAAPGGGARALNGSSMAMAHAAGVAALWHQALRKAGRSLGPQALVTHMVRSATTDTLSPGLTEFDRGAGLIQAPAHPLPSPRRVVLC